MKFTITRSEKLIKSLIHNIQGMSFGSAQKSIRLGKVKVNNIRTKKDILLNIGDVVEIYEIKKSRPQLPILYEDDNIIIITKPYGIECATRDKSSQNTYSIEEILEDKKIFVIIIIERLTEGIVVLAKSKEIASKFDTIFKTRQVEKFYQACVFGDFKQIGIQTAFLKKNPKDSTVEISEKELPDYKKIITEFNIISTSSEYSILDIKLHTGRTHQIRAHLKHLGHSILGDNKYNTKKEKNKNDLLQLLKQHKYEGYCLTAYKLKFNITDNKLKYLNSLNIEISPTWKSIFEQTFDKKE